jgi:hypothetical protein
MESSIRRRKNPYFLNYFMGWIGTESTITEATKWPIVPDLDDEWWRVECLAGVTEVLGENLPNAALPTTNPTRLYPGSNAGRHCGKPARIRICLEFRKELNGTYRQLFQHRRAAFTVCFKEVLHCHCYNLMHHVEYSVKHFTVHCLLYNKSQIT